MSFSVIFTYLLIISPSSPKPHQQLWQLFLIIDQSLFANVPRLSLSLIIKLGRVLKEWRTSVLWTKDFCITLKWIPNQRPQWIKRLFFEQKLDSNSDIAANLQWKTRVISYHCRALEGAVGRVGGKGKETFRIHSFILVN